MLPSAAQNAFEGKLITKLELRNMFRQDLNPQPPPYRISLADDTHVEFRAWCFLMQQQNVTYSTFLWQARLTLKH